MSEARAIAVVLSANVSGYIAQMHRAGAATETALGKANRATTLHGKALAATGVLAKGAGLAIAGGLALAVKEAADFNEKMALVQSLSHASQAEMRRLSDAAKTVGVGFGYTATEVADGQAEMIKAGVSLRDILGGGLKGTLALAAAGQTDVATATSIAASALTQFNLKGRDMPHIADLLAAGADKALGSVGDLGYGLSQAGTTAHQMNLSIEDTVGTLAEFAQAGLTGERGGTTFKQMLLQLAAPTKQAQELMDKYHLSLYDANGQMKSMPEIAGNLERSFKHIDPAARNAALGVIFGSRAIQGANILLKDGEAGNRKWIRSVNDQGFAAQQASGKLNSLKGDLQKFKAEAVSDLIDLGQGSQGGLRGFVQNLTGDLHRLRADGSLKRWGDEAGHALSSALDTAKRFGPVVGSALSTVASGVKRTADAFGSLPDGVQKALVTGGIAAIVAHKTGVDSLALKSLKGLTGSAATALGAGAKGGVVPVFVTNKGFDGKGGSGGGGSLPGVGGLGGSALLGSRAGVAGTVAAVVTYLSYQGTKANYRTKDGGEAYNLGGGRIGDLARGNISMPRIDLSGGLAGGGIGSLGRGVDYDKVAAGIKHVTQVSLGMKSGFQSADHAGSDFGAVLNHAVKDVADAANPVIAKTGLTVRQMVAGFRTLPKGVQIKLATPGAVQSRVDVQALAKQFHLTPKQVRVLMQLSGVKQAEKNAVDVGRALRDVGKQHPEPKVTLADKVSTRAHGVRKLMDDIGGLHEKPTADLHDKASPQARRLAAYLRSVGAMHPTPTIGARDLASGVIRNAMALLHSLDGQHADTYVVTHYSNSFSGSAGPGRPNTSGSKHSATGGYIRGPGTPTSDSIPAYLSDGEYVVRAAAVAKYGVNMFDHLNAMAFAGGGRVGFASGGQASSGHDSKDSPEERAHKARLAGANHELSRFRGELSHASGKLKDLQQTAAEYRQSVRDAFTHDVFNQGGLAGFALQLRADTNDARTALSLERTLKAKGLSGGLAKDLAASGDLTTIRELAGLSRSQIGSYQRLYAGRATATGQLAAFAGAQVYGSAIATLQRQVHRQNALISEQTKVLKHLKKDVHDGVQKGVTDKNRATHRRRRANG